MNQSWLAPAALLAGLAVLYCAYRHYRSKYAAKPLGQAAVLASCVLTALFADERLVRLLPLPGACRALYGMNYSVKWEALALVATGTISWIYWKEELKGKDRIRQDEFSTAATSILFAILCILFAIVFLVASLWADSRDWKFGLFGVHFLLVWGAASCFLKADRATWVGVIPEHDKDSDLRNISMLTYYLADWPAVASLSLLGLYCVIHWLEHTYYPHSLHPYLHSSPMAVDQVNIWVSEEYFVGGAIAFQYLMSTTIYLIMAWGIIKIRRGESLRSIEVARDRWWSNSRRTRQPRRLCL